MLLQPLVREVTQTAGEEDEFFMIQAPLAMQLHFPRSYKLIKRARLPGEGDYLACQPSLWNAPTTGQRDGVSKYFKLDERVLPIIHQVSELQKEDGINAGMATYLMC